MSRCDAATCASSEPRARPAGLCNVVPTKDSSSGVQIATATCGASIVRRRAVSARRRHELRLSHVVMQVAVRRARRAGAPSVRSVANGHCDMRTFGHAVNVALRPLVRQ